MQRGDWDFPTVLCASGLGHSVQVEGDEEEDGEDDEADDGEDGDWGTVGYTLRLGVLSSNGGGAWLGVGAYERSDFLCLKRCIATSSGLRSEDATDGKMLRTYTNASK